LENFKIQMVSDRNAELSKLFGVLNPESWNAARGTFIISPERVIKSIEIVTEPIGRSSSELIRKIKALEFVRSNPGLACPASWNTGEKTLQPSIKIAGHVGEQLQ
jgi:peroxiredoxin (alkyl hydroperoxide reductase subunit C)